ncbi:hypothetical protein [Nocardioides sp. Soil805]|uniref:hypothetical protein n=1 Tax=Nocardioides sp. Soil805 TaxID=1736416 RepID=UPI0007037BB4|nr:hypothetical protein [Nocardioides sp. Soil805]KRF34100.1 hypothetical protein ASG94_15270 [Nocardioides sp. Soil805]
MKTATRLTALTGVATLLAAPLALAVTAPAHADVDRGGACGTGRHELSVDRERRSGQQGFEVDAGLEGVAPFSRWTLVVRHDGGRVVTTTRTADDEGDVDVDTWRRNTAGRDTFSFTATQVGGSTRCGTSITVR